jgi:hypothetical protein
LFLWRNFQHSWFFFFWSNNNDFRGFFGHIFEIFLETMKSFTTFLNWLGQKYRRILNISTSYLFGTKKWLHLYHHLLEINKLQKSLKNKSASNSLEQFWLPNYYLLIIILKWIIEEWSPRKLHTMQLNIIPKLNICSVNFCRVIKEVLP